MPSCSASTAARIAVSGVRASWLSDDNMNWRSSSRRLRSLAACSILSAIESNVYPSSPSSSLRSIPVRADRSPSPKILATSEIRLRSRNNGLLNRFTRSAARAVANAVRITTNWVSWDDVNIDAAPQMVVSPTTRGPAMLTARMRRLRDRRVRTASESPTTNTAAAIAAYIEIRRFCSPPEGAITNSVPMNAAAAAAAVRAPNAAAIRKSFTTQTGSRPHTRSRCGWAQMGYLLPSTF